MTYIASQCKEVCKAWFCIFPWVFQIYKENLLSEQRGQFLTEALYKAHCLSCDLNVDDEFKAKLSDKKY